MRPIIIISVQKYSKVLPAIEIEARGFGTQSMWVYPNVIHVPGAFYSRVFLCLMQGFLFLTLTQGQRQSYLHMMKSATWSHKILSWTSLVWFWHDCLWFSEQELLWNLVIKPLVLPYVVISKVRLGKNETVGIQLFASSENAGDSQVIISGGSKNLRMCLSDVQTALKLQKTCSHGYVLTEWRHSNVNLRLDYSFQFQSSYWHFCRVLRHQDIDNQAALIRLMQIVW